MKSVSPDHLCWELWLLFVFCLKWYILNSVQTHSRKNTVLSHYFVWFVNPNRSLLWSHVFQEVDSELCSATAFCFKGSTCSLVRGCLLKCGHCERFWFAEVLGLLLLRFWWSVWSSFYARMAWIQHGLLGAELKLLHLIQTLIRIKSVLWFLISATCWSLKLILKCFLGISFLRVLQWTGKCDLVP